MSHFIENPILEGFNPDPSILRVDKDFYIATSTFEWLPGVQIHHSRDLIHWELITHAITRKSQLDLIGCESSGGVWAPCLSYKEGIYYLIYSNVKSYKGAHKDVHNYLIMAEDVEGPWTDPVYLNSSGFDPSLFHDDDGKKWLLNMLWDHSKYKIDINSVCDVENNQAEHETIKDCFAGIVLQQYDPSAQKLIGPIHNIFEGTPIGLVEGPHLYKRNGYYYLMTAEGGTFYSHAVTMSRSKQITGPYEPDPGNPILTSMNNPELRLQKAGHASLTDTLAGRWYMAHLCGRPILPSCRCILGRETALQECFWTNEGWLRVVGGGEPSDKAPAAEFVPDTVKDNNCIDDFDQPELNINFSTLRDYCDSSWLSLTERPSYLRLYGRESLESRYQQSLIARRIQSFSTKTTISVEFEPLCFQQMAGLIYLHDIKNYYYLRISRDKDNGKNLKVVYCDNGSYFELDQTLVEIEDARSIYLSGLLQHGSLVFSYSYGQENWIELPAKLDATKLSDEYSQEGKFTGAFVGMCVQDFSGAKIFADFDYFIYELRSPNNGD